MEHCSSLGSPDPQWVPDPRGLEARDVALTHLQHLVVRRLALKGVTARLLAARLGQSEESWRMKLNGERRLTLTDLLGLILAVDREIGHLPPFKAGSLEDAFPQPHRRWLSHNAWDEGLPTFRLPPDVWEVVATHIDEWWEEETRRGRGWTLTREVIRHQILSLFDSRGLRSSTAAVSALGDKDDLAWVADGATCTLLYLETSHGSQPVSPDVVASSLKRAGEALWQLAAAPHDAKVLAVVAPEVVRFTLRQVLPGPGAGGAWKVASLQEARKLGLPPDSPDLHFRVVHASDSSQIDWIMVK